MVFDVDTYYRVTRQIGFLRRGDIVHFKQIVWRRSPRKGFYAAFARRCPDGSVSADYVRVSSSHKGPNAFAKVSPLEALAVWGD